MAIIVSKLDFDDPTVFAICSGACSRHGNGQKVGNYFGKAYTRRKWSKKPKCDNCGSAMKRLYEVDQPPVRRRRIEAHSRGPRGSTADAGYHHTSRNGDPIS